MKRICVFAGTTEGRRLVEYLSTQEVEVTACVATEYGKELLSCSESKPSVQIRTGRLSEEEMRQWFCRVPFSLVIDATHPYAEEVTSHLVRACQETKTEYLRVLREKSETGDRDDREEPMVFVSDVPEAVSVLSHTEGNILLTTGSKELKYFCSLPDFAERIYARVLPSAESLSACTEAGLSASHILAMQGPFSEELNLALLHTTAAVWLVTKDGGEAGGFLEKVSAARQAGVKVLVIGRPAQREGCSLAETLTFLKERFGFSQKAQVQIVGIGAGSREAMTQEVFQALGQAEVLIGAKRMLQAAEAALQGTGKKPLVTKEAITPEQIADAVFRHPEASRFVIVMSGDTGFYSGTKKLLPFLSGCEVTVLAGISSLSYFCAKVKKSYEDLAVASIHGRNVSIVPYLRENRRVFVVSGGDNGVRLLCRQLIRAGFGSARLTVGERLSYPEERITEGTAEELAEKHFDSLSVVLIERDPMEAIVTHGLPDSFFQRGKHADGMVPMTKQEVRAVALAKLQLTEHAVCWDIGAGTGSVSVELALQARRGAVYAVEQKKEALELLKENKARFQAENLTVIEGRAPEVCRTLPPPTHVFIGGSGGQMRSLLRLLFEKNPLVRIVAAVISLESLAELTSVLQTEFAPMELEVVSIQIARDKKAGSYHLMTGQNPVYLFTIQKKQEGEQRL